MSNKQRICPSRWSDIVGSPSLVPKSAKNSIFSAETDAFQKRSTFWTKRTLLIFCVVCFSWVSRVPVSHLLLFFITIHQAETASSDKDILARLKLLRKSNVSSNARCFVKGLHSLSSFMVGIWGEMQFIHLHPNCLIWTLCWNSLKGCNTVRFYSKLRACDGVWTARCHQRKHTLLQRRFFESKQTFLFAAKRPFFPTVRGRRNSSSQTLRYCCLLTVNQGVHYSTHPNCVGLSLLVAPFTQSTPLMFDRIDAKIMLITETCLIEQQLMLVFDFVDLLTSRLSKLILATLRKGPFTAIMSEAWPTWGHFISGKKRRYFWSF